MRSKTYELIGDDCQIVTGELGATEYEGDAAQTLEELFGGVAGGHTSAGFYIITAKGAATFFPTGLNVNEMMPMDGSEVLAAGDKVKKLSIEALADASGWNAKVSQSEVNTTRLSHTFTKYRFGKKDMQLTINSITTLGISDEAKGTIGRTMKLFRQDDEGNITISNPDNLPIYIIAYVRETSLPGETNAYMFAQVNLTGGGLGGAIGSAQSNDLTARLTGMDPIFYSIDIPAA